MSDHRRLGIAAGTALLSLAVAGCSGLGRTAVGTVTYETQRHAVVTVSNPLVTGCHRLAPSGAHRVENNTLVDLWLYTTPNCTGSNAEYVATTMFNNIAPGALPWRSYSTVH
ncbi:hypothetical protein [Streptomyces sp. NPDC000410]|uniref:hypothetical protein n=1 Tax=Streptomyces sp. NPDC000410 TaxID=3154254 RepID=UPI003321EB8C